MLAEFGLFDTVWTTNFDGLVSRAAANYKLTPIEIGIDSQERLYRQPSKGELWCISLHGDYRYDKLKNTIPEVQAQESQLINAFISQTKNKPLIVSGYSGRDKSIMSALESAYSKKGKGILYWCGYGNAIHSDVNSLIRTARKSGHEAYFVPTEGFDQVMTRLSLFCLSGNFRDRSKKLVSTHQLTDKVVETFDVPNSLKTSGLLKSNVFKSSSHQKSLSFHSEIGKLIFGDG